MVVMSLSKIAYMNLTYEERETYRKFVPKEMQVDWRPCCWLMNDLIRTRDVYDEDSVCELTAFWGHLDCLQLARQIGIPWDVNTTQSAAASGSLDCLRYAHEQGCPWDEMTCARAARNGEIECLRYAHQNGCPWDTSTTMLAAHNAQLECLVYALENRCDWDRDRTVRLLESYTASYPHYRACFEYARGKAAVIE